MKRDSQESMMAGSTYSIFNQSPPYGGNNLFASNPLLDGAAAGFPDEVRRDLADIGQFWGSTDARELGRLANANLPELKRYDASGRRRDQVDLHPAYHALMRRSAAAGLHCSTWDDEQGGTRHRSRAARLFMAAQTECGHLCPMTMTHASVASLRHSPDLFVQWLPPILSRTYDRAFRPAPDKRGVTIGMGMTEKQGGTDVCANSTTAEPGGEDGFYRITGHKWFMSAPMSDAFVVLAKTGELLSAFLMPRFLPDGSVNAIRLERLKDKLGNRSNASAEVEFDEAGGFLIGEQGRGIVTILEMATLTRLDCAIASAGLMRAGMAEAVHHCRHRQTFGAALIDQPLMTRVLADMALDQAATFALIMRLAEAYDMMAERPEEAAYARLMTPAVKYWVCKSAPAFLFEAMECLGGNGYVEESALPRLYREAPVNAIWEGSGNVMCLDLLRAIEHDPGALDAVGGILADEMGAGADTAVNVLKAAASVSAQDHGSARVLTEQLALTAAAAALRRDYPPVFADAFVEARLGRPWAATYGMLDNRFDARAFVDYVCPEGR